MLISKTLISHFLPEITKLSYSEIEKALLRSGIEVEDYESIIPPTKLAYGIIKEITKVECSNKLNLCTVFLPYENLTTQIICGANNVQVNLKVLVAMNGALLTNKKVTILKKRIFNVESNGMICSYKELYESKLLDKSFSSILPLIIELGEDWECNQPYKPEHLNLNDDIFLLSIPVNRRDLNCAWSIAQELSKNLKIKQTNNPSFSLSDFESWKIKKVLLTNNILLTNPSLNIYLYIYLVFNEWVEVKEGKIINKSKEGKSFKFPEKEGLTNDLVVYKKSPYFLSTLTTQFLANLFPQHSFIPNLSLPQHYFIISWSKTLRLLNKTLKDKEEIIKALTPYSFVFKETKESTIIPPIWRIDLKNENNFLAELSNIFDLNTTKPQKIQEIKLLQQNTNKFFQKAKEIRNFFISHGFIETNTFNLQSSEEVNKYNLFEEKIEELINGNKNSNTLRKHGLIELIKTIEYNLQHQNTLLPLFELINISSENKTYLTLNIISPNTFSSFALNDSKIGIDAYNLLSLIKKLFFQLGIDLEFKEDKEEKPPFANNQKIQILSSNKVVGYLGNIFYLNQQELSGCVIKLEFNDFSYIKNKKPELFSLYPPCYKDISIKINKGLSVEIKEIISLIKEHEYCRECLLINKYETEDAISYLFRYKLHSFSKTLNNKEIQICISEIERVIKTKNLHIN